MIDPTDPLSFILWAIVAFAAGLYPLGFMFPTACNNCCAPSCGDEFEFKRCARFEAVTQTTRGETFTQDDASVPLFANGWPAIPAPVHGFSRSIARPEDIGVFRVTDEAIFRSAIRVNLSSVTSTTVRFALLDYATLEVLETIYTFTIQLDEEAEVVTYEENGERAMTISVPPSALSNNEITVPLVTPSPVGRTVFRDYRNSIEFELFGYHRDWTQFVYRQSAPYYGNEVAVEVIRPTFAYAAKIDDFQYTSISPPYYSQSEYIWDKNQVVSFMNGGSTLRYVDPHGKEWDVTIQGDTPLCGVHYSESIADVDFPYLLTVEVSSIECADRRAKFDMVGCADYIGNWLLPNSLTHSRLYRRAVALYATVFSDGNQIRDEELKRVVGYGFPYGPDVPPAGQYGYGQYSICYFKQEQTGCSVPAIYSVPSEAFFCGDLLWVLENGPCSESLTLIDRNGRSSDYELNTTGQSQATEATRKWCLEQNETAHQSNIYVVYDYRPRFDGTCWPPTGTVQFPATWYPQNLETSTGGNIQYDYIFGQGAQSQYWYSNAGEGGWQQKSEFTLHLVTAGCESAMYESRHASDWAQFRLFVQRQCDGSIAIQSAPLAPKGFSKVQPGTPTTDEQLSRHADARVPYFFSIEGGGFYNWAASEMTFTAGASGPPPVASSVQSVSGDHLPAEGGTVTVETSGNGVGDRTTTFTIGRNSMRFPRAIFLQPEYSKRVNGSPIDSPSYTDDAYLVRTPSPPFVRVTQEGYGGEEDDKCHIAVVWISGVTQTALYNNFTNRNVFADFTKVSCLVGQPSVVEGTTCDWSVESDNEHVLAVKEDGLVKVTVGAGAMDAGSQTFMGGLPVKTITATLTFSTPLEDIAWSVLIKLANL